MVGEGDPEDWLPLLGLFQGAGVDPCRGESGKGEKEPGGVAEGLSAPNQDAQGPLVPEGFLFLSSKVFTSRTPQHFFHASQVTDMGYVFAPTAEVIGREDLSRVPDEQNKEKG